MLMEKELTKGLVKDISNYKSIFNPNISTDATTYKMGNYLNKNIYDVKKELENKFKNVIIIGNCSDEFVNLIKKSKQ